MRRLSYWGKLNPWKARITIVVSHILLMLLGWYAGKALFHIDISLPCILLFVFIIYYLAAVFIYPLKNEKQSLGKSRFYFRQKFCDFSLAAAAYGMMVCIASSEKAPYEYFHQSLNSSSAVAVIEKEKPTAGEILESLKYRDKNSLSREEKRILKKEFKIQLKKYVVAKIKGDKDAAGNAGLIILSIVLALGLLYLVAALACNLSCNGNDGAALLVGILGTAAIIIGLIFVIKGIKKKAIREKENKGAVGA